MASMTQEMVWDGEHSEVRDMADVRNDKTDVPNVNVMNEPCSGIDVAETMEESSSNLTADRSKIDGKGSRKKKFFS